MVGLLKIPSATSIRLNTTSHDWLGRADNATIGRHELFVKRGTSMHAQLQRDLPGVPPDRIGKPFVRFYRTDLLLSPDEIVALVDNVNDADLAQSLHIGSSIKAAGWPEEVLRGARRPSWPGQQNSVLFISTGPHFNAVCTGTGSREAVQRVHRLVVSCMLLLWATFCAVGC